MLTLAQAACTRGAASPTSPPQGAAETATRTQAQTPQTAVGSPSVQPSPTFAQPYPIPTTCGVTSLVGPQTRRGFFAYWLDGDGLSAGNEVGLFFEGDNKIQWQAEPQNAGDLAVTGKRIDVPESPPLVVKSTVIGVATWSTGTTFPAPGCWRLHATVGTHTLDATVYVYPDACRPPALRVGTPPASPSPCAPPTS